MAAQSFSTETRALRKVCKNQLGFQLLGCSSIGNIACSFRQKWRFKKWATSKSFSETSLLGFPKVTDMILTSSSIKLKVPEGSRTVVVKNLYLSCDPYMNLKMGKPDSTLFYDSFKPGSVDILKSKFGFDETFNYKVEHNLSAALKHYFPEAIDIYSDNVGGAMLDAVLLNMRVRGRIAVCGMISQYNLDKHEGVHNLFSLVTKWIQMQGFIRFDYLHQCPELLELAVQYVKDGNIVYLEDIATGLESAPSVLIGLLSGRNVGKQVVLVAHV